MGDQFDASKMMSFGAGSFAYLDPSMHHYAAASGDRYESLHGLRKQRKSPTSIGRFRQSRAKSATRTKVQREMFAGEINLPLKPSVAGTVVRRARCVYGVERRLPAAAEDGIGGIAIDRRADRPTRPGNGQSAQRAPRRRSAAGGGPWSGSGLSTADHCTSFLRAFFLNFQCCHEIS